MNTPNSPAGPDSRIQSKVKICGITSIADAEAAVEAGADALGLVFYPPSPRCIDIEEASQIVAAVGPFVCTVGLFVNEDPARVTDILSKTRLQLLQFHGDENGDYCEKFQRPYIKAVRMGPGQPVEALFEDYPAASAVLYDGWKPGEYGGTGTTFDWRRVVGIRGGKVILAGGLTPDNVADAVAVARPYAVDVSGGVESGPGRKDHGKLRAFVSAAKSL